MLNWPLERYGPAAEVVDAEAEGAAAVVVVALIEVAEGVDREDLVTGNALHRKYIKQIFH